MSTWRNGVEIGLELYMLLVVLDLVLAWLQTTEQAPRRWTHVLTEPLQAPLRPFLARLGPGGWDLSALWVVVLLGLVRVCWVLQ